MATENYTAFWLGYVPSGPGHGPRIGDVPTYIDTLILAFANLYPGNTTCQSFLFKSNSEDSIRAGMAELKEKSPDTKILLSIQGTPSPNVGWNEGITDPDAFGAWCASLAAEWHLDGFDVDNEDPTFPGEKFVAAVKGMRAAMPDLTLTMDSYLFERDQPIIKELADDLDVLNTDAYFLDFDEMTSLVEQYATVIDPSKISIGVKAGKVGIDQGTSLETTKKLCTWEPSGGSKQGIMLWNVSNDLESYTGQPDGSWTRLIHECLP